MGREKGTALSRSTIRWPAALTPDPTMIPSEDIFLLHPPVPASTRSVSLTATIDNSVGLLFQSPDALLQGIPAPTRKKRVRTRVLNAGKNPRRRQRLK